MISLILFYLLQVINQVIPSNQIKTHEIRKLPSVYTSNVDSLLKTLSPFDTSNGIIVNDTSLFIVTQQHVTPDQAIYSPQIKHTEIRFSPSLKLLFNNYPYIRTRIVTLHSGLVEFNSVYTTFLNEILINVSYYPLQLFFDSTYFNESFSLTNATQETSGDNNIRINKSIFNDSVEFHFSHVKSLIIDNSVFKKRFVLQPSEINGNTSTINKMQFRNVSFSGFTSFKNLSTNSLNDLFITCTFSDTLELSNIVYNSNFDLNRSDLSQLTALIIEDFNYNNGDFICDWENIKGTNFPKIRLANPTNDINDNYYRIEKIYKKLRNNYIAQGDKVSADAVMHELGWQKEIITNSGLQYIYGITIGYGYEPWRYFCWVLLIGIFPFFLYYYFFYFGVVNYIVRKPNDNLHPLYKTVKKFNIKWSIVDHNSINYSTLLKILICLYFSFAVLLGIRLKKEWFEDNRRFLKVVVAQYIFGIFLYILFLVLIQTSQFDSFKSLLGF